MEKGRGRLEGQKHKVWTTKRRPLSVSQFELSALICSLTCRALFPCLIAGLREEAARVVGLHRQSYICLSVITNQDEGYMGNYHWKLIPEAYGGILDMSQLSLCLIVGPHSLVIDIMKPIYLSGSLLVHTHANTVTHTQSCITVLMKSLQELYLCHYTSFFPLISSEAYLHMYIWNLEGNTDFPAQYLEGEFLYWMSLHLTIYVRCQSLVSVQEVVSQLSSRVERKGMEVGVVYSVTLSCMAPSTQLFQISTFVLAAQS